LSSYNTIQVSYEGFIVQPLLNRALPVLQIRYFGLSTFGRSGIWEKKMGVARLT